MEATGSNGGYQHLGRAFMVLGGIGIGAYFYGRLFSKANEGLRVAAGVVPPLVGLVAARSFGSSKQSEEIHEPKFKEQFLAEGAGAPTTVAPYPLATGRTIKLYDQMPTDLERDWANYLFQKPGRRAKEIADRYERLDLSKVSGTEARKQAAARQARAYLLTMGIQDDEITALSQVVNQSLFGPAMIKIRAKYPDHILAGKAPSRIPALSIDSNRLWKIQREGKATILTAQNVLRLFPDTENPEAPRPETVFYVSAKTVVNWKTGAGTITLSSPSKTPPDILLD